MVDKVEKKPSCGYTGKVAEEDTYANDKLVAKKGERLVQSCVNGQCWFLLPLGIGYQDCPKCSVPDIEPVAKNENLDKETGEPESEPKEIEKSGGKKGKTKSERKTSRG